MSNTSLFIPFEHAITKMEMPYDSLRVEKIITSSMNNYVVNVNCEGITWAVGIRYPKQMDREDFIHQKTRTAAIANYLADKFQNGIQLDSTNTFVFDGRSYLSDPSSTKNFFQMQSSRPPIVIQDEVSNMKKEIKGIPVPMEYLTYDGPFYISKGAPANETLEHDINFYPLMLKSLAVLHTHTGVVRAVSEMKLTDALKHIYSAFTEKADAWEPNERASENKRIDEYVKKYGDSTEVFTNIKREVFLQSNLSTELLHSLTSSLFTDFLNNSSYLSFIHGDAHGANFIIVQFEFEKEKNSSVFIDRQLVNNIFTINRDLDKIVMEKSNTSAEITYRNYQSDDLDRKDVIRLIRTKHNEVHLIDIDTGKGITKHEKQLYLFDTITLCLSIYNWSHIHQSPVKDFKKLSEIYLEEFNRHR